MRFTLLCLFVTFTLGCISREASEVCESDGECADNLSCLEITTGTSSSCEVFGNVCSQTCNTDADCRELSEGTEEFRCFAQCDGSSICSRAEVKTDDLPASAVCELTSDCAEGLSCLPVSAFDASDVCAEVGMACSIRCETNEDCAELGTNFECFDGCDSTRVCAARG